MFVIVIASLGHVGRPRPAKMMDESAGQRQRALLEIVMMMRRHLGRIAGAVARLQEVHHEGRAAKDPPEPSRRCRDVEAVGADLLITWCLRPRLERRQVGMRPLTTLRSLPQTISAPAPGAPTGVAASAARGSLV
ncbi:hypothetical protein [Bradyrhizobium sp.]|uniref:hypothetical protein n=1 Tax=Bradyrhizobium sp. TaxID=376 RepID=UPI002BE87D51|nr:hypothetical protein [Bradyrhizobium sp.]HMM91747.1 hypothetical protein [Bradyrhizobium sp.]